MITPKIIQELTTKYQTLEENVWREYFQHIFLAAFYQQKETDKIYFKGGTALRFIYRSPRFSEDLDFSSSIKEISQIEQAIIAALAEIEREGIATELDEAKSTSGGYLALTRFKVNGNTSVVQLEISLREEGIKGKSVRIISDFPPRSTYKISTWGSSTVVVSDFIPPYTVMQLFQQQLVAGKLSALLSRRKPRDFYDLYFMLRAGLLSGEQKNLLSQALEVLHQSSNLNFEQELKIFLPKSHWPIIRELPQALEGEIQRFL